MNRRSRAGCVDCRKAKVKCDEQNPACGTCIRRGKTCRGYDIAKPQKPLKWTTAYGVEGLSLKRRRSTVPRSPLSGQHAEYLVETRNNAGEHAIATSPDSSFRNVDVDISWSNSNAQLHALESLDIEAHALAPLQSQSEPTEISYNDAIASNSPEVFLRLSPLRFELSSFWNPKLTPDTSRGVEIYFARHPVELVIGSEPFFIHEMNTHVLAALQSDVEAVSDSLCAIGSVYLHNAGLHVGLELALGSKIKTLSRIRRSSDIDFRDKSIEQIMSMILGLVSMELIDTHYNPSESSMTVLHTAAAAVIAHAVSKGSVFSSTAKYLIRALAREDMLMALLHRRRPLISTSAWLDEDCRVTADRFMGYTMTLMPLLEELSGLAEDLEELQKNSTLESPLNEDATTHHMIETRADDLRRRISAWNAPYVPMFSGSSSRKFLLHAGMYRTAALLYLHRLRHRHGSSSAQDKEALALAYDIFAHLSTEPRDNRLSLFPIFLAACEFQSQEDRDMAEECLIAIHKSRNTYTTLLTGRFVRERVWKARDRGENWEWIRLVDQWKGECVPI